MKPKEPIYQVALDALALTTCYTAFLITAKVPVIYMHQLWVTVTKHKSSYRFKIDNKKFYVNVKVFKDILNICLRIQGQESDEPPTEEELTGYHEIRLQTCRHSSIWCNQALLDSVAYKTYHAIASGAEPPKSRKSQKKSDSTISSEESPSKKKSAKAKKVVATKPKPTKKKAPVKADRGKGLNVLSEVALSKAGQLKEAIERSKKDSHASHPSSSSTDERTEEDDNDENDSKDESDDDGNDDADDDKGNDGNDDNDDDANNDDNLEDDDMNDNDEETDSDRTE
ncbi:hypothetical protein Tco_1471626 [Tanacetum coccineum]